VLATPATLLQPRLLVRLLAPAPLAPLVLLLVPLAQALLRAASWQPLLPQLACRPPHW
jgi:hypothetical protein